MIEPWPYLLLLRFDLAAQTEVFAQQLPPCGEDCFVEIILPLVDIQAEKKKRPTDSSVIKEFYYRTKKLKERFHI